MRASQSTHTSDGVYARRQNSLAVNLFKLVTSRCYDRSRLLARTSDVRIVTCLRAEALISCITPTNHSARGSAAFAVIGHSAGASEHITSFIMLFDRDAYVSKEVFKLLLVLTLHNLVFRVTPVLLALVDCASYRFMMRHIFT